MNKRRTTIYDIAKEMHISVSYVSKALNNHPSISKVMKEKVRKKAEELNYINHFSLPGFKKKLTKTIGVIVPNINRTFFSEVISGIEEICIEKDYNILPCQSYDSYKKECAAIESLVAQDVDCVLISFSTETESAEHLQILKKKKIEIIQLDRYIEDFSCHKVTNDNEEISIEIIKFLHKQAYKKISFIGGPEKASVYNARKKGYLQGLADTSLPLIPDYIRHCNLVKDYAFEITQSLLAYPEPPDAFMTVSDTLAIGVHEAVQSLNFVPGKQIGIIGFTNEPFTQLVKPTISSVDQQSKELGRRAAYLYFDILREQREGLIPSVKEEIIKAKIIARESTCR